MKCMYCDERKSEGYLMSQTKTIHQFICYDCLADYVEDNLDDIIAYFEYAYVTMEEDDTMLVDQLFIGEEFTCDSFYEWCYDHKAKVVEALVDHFCTRIKVI